MDILAHAVVWLNMLANALGAFFLAPIAVMPGWQSATLVSAATGVLLLVIFKYTSNQRAIKAVRSDIKAHLLALKLFKDSTWVTFRAQGRILLGALKLLALALVPMAVMAIPVCLLLAQLALWYQARPLPIGEDAVVTLKLNGSLESSWPEVRLEPDDALEVAVGPVRVFSEREVCWRISGRKAGYHRLVFHVSGQPVAKELAIGDGFMRVSTQRPGWDWWDALWHPAEAPFGPDSPVQLIKIDYPSRASWTSGTDSWLIYWFVVSMVSALCFRRLVNVNI
jgi:hypothetical protein